MTWRTPPKKSGEELGIPPPGPMWQPRLVEGGLLAGSGSTKIDLRVPSSRLGVLEALAIAQSLGGHPQANDVQATEVVRDARYLVSE
jgi:hypothetical protein